MPSYSSSHSSKGLFSERENPPAHHLVAFSDGGARGNPGPSGYGVVIQDEAGRKVAALSEYLGHQTNNFAEYQGLIAALEYAVANGHKALKVISDSELLVRQIKGHLQSEECRTAGSSRSRKRIDRTARAGFPSGTFFVATTKKPTAWPMPPWTEAWDAWRGRRRPCLSWEIFRQHDRSTTGSFAQERSNYSMANSPKEPRSKCALRSSTKLRWRTDARPPRTQSLFVDHRIPQRPYTLDADLNHISRNYWTHAFRSAGRDHIARSNRHGLRNVANDDTQ